MGEFNCSSSELSSSIYNSLNSSLQFHLNAAIFKPLKILLPQHMSVTFYPKHVENILLFIICTHFNVWGSIKIHWIVIGVDSCLKHVNFKFVAKFLPWRITLSFNFYHTLQRDQHSFSFESFPFFLSVFLCQTKSGAWYHLATKEKKEKKINEISNPQEYFKLSLLFSIKPSWPAQ